MKKLLLILLCLPLIGLGQVQNRWGLENKCVSGNCINGYGEYIYWVDGMVDGGESTYSGYFKDGKFNGKGEIVCDLGRFEGDAADYYIIGNWKDGKLHGDAITYNRSQSYECGDVPHEIDNGDTLRASSFESTYSTLLQETIIKYSGQYEEGLLNGFGFMSINSFRYSSYDPDKSGIAYFDERYEESYSEIYIGQWDEGLMNGFGRYFYKNGDIYEGDWINDKKQGRGKIIYNGGTVEEGLWENDKFLGN